MVSGAARSWADFVEGCRRVSEKDRRRAPSECCRAGPIEGSACCGWKASWLKPLPVRSRGRAAAASAIPDRRRLHAASTPAVATSGAHDRLSRASVQPCTRSSGRHGSAGGASALPVGPARLLARQHAAGDRRVRRGSGHRWVCSGFTSIAEVGEQCPARELRCGCGRSRVKAPSAARESAPGERLCGSRSDARAGAFALIAGGRRSLLVSPSPTGHAVSRGSGVGSSGRPTPQGRPTSEPGSA